MSDSDSTTRQRTCTACGETFPATTEYFYKESRNGTLFSQCKTCYLARCKAYRGANKEQYSAAGKRRYQSTREEVLARSKARYAAKREAILIQHRKWREAHPGYWKKNWEADPGRVRAKNANRRAVLHDAEGSFTRQDIDAQLKRQKGRCFYCDSQLGADYHREHVTPLALGGSNGPENIVIACPECNLSKGAKHPMDFAGILF